MGHELLDSLTELVASTSWPDNSFINAKSQHIYETGMDVLNMYRGHPDVLIDALRLFYQTESQPYAYAGIAATLISASYSHGDVYEGDGLRQAQQWLERAQASIADRVEINVVEASLYISMREYDNARLILDYFQQENYEHYQICLAEMHYWQRKESIPQVSEWYRKAMALSTTKVRKIVALNILAGCYLSNKHYKQTIEAYRHLAKLDANDPWLWHNSSIAHYNLKQYKDAAKCNKKALELMDFQAARDMGKAIEYKLKQSRWF